MAIILSVMSMFDQDSFINDQMRDNTLNAYSEVVINNKSSYVFQYNGVTFELTRDALDHLIYDVYAWLSWMVKWWDRANSPDNRSRGDLSSVKAFSDWKTAMKVNLQLSYLSDKTSDNQKGGLNPLSFLPF